MRSLLLSGIIMLTLSSCYSYQYLTLHSPDVARVDKHGFTWENDTLRLVYSFHGGDGPAGLTIFNKLDKPLYINWKKSAFICNGHAFSLFNSNVQVNGSIATSKSRYISGSSLNASFDLPAGTDLVPPASDIDKDLSGTMQIYPLSASILPDTVRNKSGLSPEGLSYDYRQYTFDEKGSPLLLKSYLTFMIGASTPDQKEFSISHSFFVNDVLVTDKEPVFFTGYEHDGDKLFLRHNN